MSHHGLRPLGFGEILDGAFQLYRRHFATFFATALLPMVPITLLSGTWAPEFGRMQEADDVSAAAWLGFLVWVPVAMLGFALMYGALTRQFSRAYAGGEVSAADGYRTALRVLPRMVAAGILIGVGWSVVLFVVVMVFAVFMAVFALVGDGVAGTVGMVAAVVLLLVGVSAVYLLLAALLVGTLPPLVVERLGPLQAIGRWVGLARGALPRVMGITAVTLLVFILPSFAVLLLTGSAGAFWGAPVPETAPAVFWTQQVFSTLVGAVTHPFLVAAFVLLYYDRRVRIEALDVQMAAEGLRGTA